MKILAALLLSAVAMPTFAYTANSCDFIRDVAYNATVARNHGESLKELQQRISDKPALSEQDKHIQQLQSAVTELVYVDPKYRGMMPDFVANRMRTQCQLDGKVVRQTK
jgi:hypothetical protein